MAIIQGMPISICQIEMFLHVFPNPVILVLRVWYLFSGNKIVQLGIILGFLASLGTSLYFTYVIMSRLRIVQFSMPLVSGCQAIFPKYFWRIHVPILILHVSKIISSSQCGLIITLRQTMLFTLTVVKALRNRRLLKHNPLLKQLLREYVASNANLLFHLSMLC
jgi:hypothetical protein